MAKEGGITCKDFSGMISAFMNDTLDDAALRAFLDHYEACKNCREELEIQYLVGKAFNQMEKGEEINLFRDLPAYVEKERRLLENRVRLSRTAAILEAFTVAMAVLTAVIYFS